MNDTQTLKQPKVFHLAITIALFERFAFYILSFLLVLYIESVFNFSDHEAFLLFGVLTALVYIAPALGGYLADNIIGIRRTIILGILLEGFGLTLIAIPNKLFLLIGLSLVVIGVGLFKTGPTNLMARSYAKDDPRIDSGFTWYYMTINIGAFFAPILAGILQRYIGWSAAFFLSAGALYFNLFCYLLLRHRAKNLDSKTGKEPLAQKTYMLIIGGIIISLAIIIFLLTHTTIAHMFFFIITAIIFLYFAYEISKSSKKEQLAIIACLSLITIGTIFFIMYFQLFMSVTLFIKRSVVHKFLGFNIPTTFFLSLNGFWIVVLSPILACLYNYLGKRDKDLAITTKFPLGILITSCCFLVLKFSTYFPNSAARVSALWIILAIFLYSLGELLISALGVAMVTRIAPKRMYGVMMGTWFLISNGLGSTIASSVASLSEIPSTLRDPFLILNIYGRTFFEIGLAGIIASILAFIVAPYIRRMANI